MLNALRRRAETRRGSERLLAELVARARRPVFYEKLAVPDTIDGRFDLLVLHAWLVLEQLRQQGSARLSQSLVDALFIHFDEALREQGAGDIGMGRRMTKFADAFYGRLKAYGQAADAAALAEAIRRNVFRGDAVKVEPARALAIYAAAARERLSGQDLAAEAPDFGPEP
ncbi:MAG TPA: ubiquinol-cytochrome C chaperone family protein [Rhizomicrobium sp.]|nr:ubiquinol-cytochrome C chaperone family protein [Rhizomicrobium sp.]